jgi:hypothetical protein
VLERSRRPTRSKKDVGAIPVRVVSIGSKTNCSDGQPERRHINMPRGISRRSFNTLSKSIWRRSNQNRHAPAILDRISSSLCDSHDLLKASPKSTPEWHAWSQKTTQERTQEKYGSTRIESLIQAVAESHSICCNRLGRVCGNKPFFSRAALMFLSRLVAPSCRASGRTGHSAKMFFRVNNQANT